LFPLNRGKNSVALDKELIKQCYDLLLAA
jgi:hypothetical protein